MPAEFRESHLEIDGITIRYLEAGEGSPLVHLPGAGGLRLTPVHDLLCRRFRVVIVETPGLGLPPALASTVARGLGALGLDTFDLLGTSSGAKAALWLALEEPRRVRALVLEAPAAIRPDDRDADLERRLPDLAAPALVLFGTADGAVPPAMGRVYKERIPSCHLVFVYDATHAISTDRPEAFAEVVVDFLERGEAFVVSRARTVINP